MEIRAPVIKALVAMSHERFFLPATFIIPPAIFTRTTLPLVNSRERG